MSTTLSPPIPVDAPTEAATRPAAVPTTARIEPAPATSGRSTRRLGDTLVFTAWASALTAAALVGAAALAIATPIVLGRALYDERKYR
jgi:hypothetical protein